MIEKKAGKDFSGIGFDDFASMALDKGLSRYQKIGFPDEYRKDKEAIIFDDLLTKIPALKKPKTKILDIGCGCSDLPHYFIENAATFEQDLYFVDNAEMLSQIEAPESVKMISGKFPSPSIADSIGEAKFDAIVVYSVIQYVFQEGNFHRFIDEALKLLAPGGTLFIGDIPNASRRRRFLSSESGILHHKNYTGSDDAPNLPVFAQSWGELDDGVILGILARYRSFGFDSFILPQPEHLPMANRREDLLIRQIP
jgi:2-polyprenyl-3-methyl-5-hydroxy-6-metoxy-1,4-benzoquinol methylase